MKEEDSETSLSFVIQAENIYNFEKSLASISNSTQERRDILALYNIYPIDVYFHPPLPSIIQPPPSSSLI